MLEISLLITQAKFFDLGSPMREQMCQLAKEKPVDGDALLIVGGSQGAQRLNDIVLESIRGFKSRQGVGLFMWPVREMKRVSVKPTEI